MTEYEIKCAQTWAWYTASVHDYKALEKKLLVKYPDDWKCSEWIDLSSVRYKYTDSVSSDSSIAWKPDYNEEVECKARAEEREPYGWWPCKAQPYAEHNNNTNNNNTVDSDVDNLYSVAFIGWGNEHNEILGIEFIRKKSSSLILSDRFKTLSREVYAVPNELKEWVLNQCSANTLLETLMPHKNISSQIVHITYCFSSSSLLLIGVKRVLLTMRDIIYCFFEKQKSLLQLEEKTQELELKSKQKKEEELRAEKHTFNVHPLLSGYLRGKKGTNIEGVRRRNDKVIRIEPQNGSCYIAAKDKSSLNAAIDQLHIICKKVIIPKHEMGQIIGAQGQQIQDIKRKSQVIKVISWKLWPKEFQTLKNIQTKRYKPQSHSYNVLNEDLEGDDVDDNDEIPDIIKNATIDNIFADPNDCMDLSVNNVGNEHEIDPDLLYEQEMDALVIIGRKSRVELCVFMIEMTLKHFRTITKTRNNVRLLRQKINQIKGNPIIPISNYKKYNYKSPRYQQKQKQKPKQKRYQRKEYPIERKEYQNENERNEPERNETERLEYQNEGERYQRKEYQRTEQNENQNENQRNDQSQQQHNTEDNGKHRRNRPRKKRRNRANNIPQ